MADIPLTDAELGTLGDSQHPAIAAGVHATLFKAVAHRVAFACTGTAKGVMATAGVGDNFQHWIVLIGAQHAAAGQVNVTLLADGIHGTVAFTWIGGVIIQGIRRLITLHVEDAQCGAIADDLNGILSWIEQLSEVDVDGVEPMTSAVAMTAPMRSDVVTTGGIRDLVLANAPKSEDGFFVVPRSVE